MNKYRSIRVLGLLSVLLFSVGCAETELLIHTTKRIAKPEIVTSKPTYKVGKPYEIKGVMYYPHEDFNYDETGIASWYGEMFHGRKTANGEIYDMNALTAAHRTLPLPSYVRVTNLENGRSLVLRVNDRGPFAHSRIIDVSRRGAQLLGYGKQGVAKVRVEILSDKSRELKAQIQNQSQLAETGSPITVEKLPKPAVSSQKLAPIGSGTTTPPPPPVNTTVAVTNDDMVFVGEKLNNGNVSINPVKASEVFVQAGAYGRFVNAKRVLAKLTNIGHPVNMTSVLVKGKDYYRVRVGPFTDISEADLMLDTVAAVGYPEARIVIEAVN